MPVSVSRTDARKQARHEGVRDSKGEWGTSVRGRSARVEGKRCRSGDAGSRCCAMHGRAGRRRRQARVGSGQGDCELGRSDAQVAGVGGEFARFGGGCFSVGEEDDVRRPMTDGMCKRHLLRQEQQQCQEQRNELTHGRAG